jgi:hypothetical protein
MRLGSERYFLYANLNQNDCKRPFSANREMRYLVSLALVDCRATLDAETLSTLTGLTQLVVQVVEPI